MQIHLHICISFNVPSAIARPYAGGGSGAEAFFVAVGIRPGYKSGRRFLPFGVTKSLECEVADANESELKLRLILLFGDCFGVTSSDYSAGEQKT